MPIHAELDENGVVTKRLIFDDGREPDDFLDGAVCGIGDTWDGVSFTPPAPGVAPLAELRAAAFMPVGDFCLTLYAAGILTADDAELAAGGGWPVAFDGAIAGLSEAQQLGARIKWRTVQNVFRMDPLLLAVAAFMNSHPDLPNLTEDQLDAMFGIAG